VKLIEQIGRLLGPQGDTPGVLQRHGRVMMSSWGTVKQSRYYVLAINPGGGEINPPPAGESVGDSLCEKRDSKWSYWLHEAEANDRDYFKRVMEGLGTDPCSVPVSNALFLRSRGESHLPVDSGAVFAAHCAPVHKLLLGIVKPRVVVCFGNPTWEFVVGRRPPSHWRFNADVSFTGAGIDYSCGVLLLPHFAAREEVRRTNADTLTQAIADARGYAEQGT
jgi:hypothetical protein